MKTKSHLTVLLFSALAMIGQAANPPKSAPTVAVYDFRADADTATYARNVTTLVTAGLAGETNLVLLERGALSKALSEQALGLSGMVSSDAAAKIGQITGAKVLVAGEAMKIGDNHLVVVAHVIGTETGRLFAEMVEGAPDKLLDLTDELSRKIARTIGDQEANLIAPAQESSAERLARIIKGISGTNRPSVSLNIQWWQWWRAGPGGMAVFHETGPLRESTTAEGEFGTVLLKAGFTVVDAKSDRKPDVEITGMENSGEEPRQGDLFSCTDVMDLKVQERRTGKILAIEHLAGFATDSGRDAALAAAVANTTDAMAERILPILAK